MDIRIKSVDSVFANLEEHHSCDLVPVLDAAASLVLEVAAPGGTRFSAQGYKKESKRLIPSAKIRSGVMRLTTR